MARPSLVREFWLFLRHEKKWWMIPLLLVLLLLGGLMALSASSPLGLFLYPLW
ncbi:MAG: hypothetical protein HZA54_09795 [Planctomycetes bacterium]|nr:hypothetical protein [Planctomycetota bacterium]